MSLGLMLILTVLKRADRGFYTPFYNLLQALPAEHQIEDRFRSLRNFYQPWPLQWNKGRLEYNFVG